MSKLVKILKYNFNSDYRRKIDGRRKFAQIMAVNKSIMEGLK